MTTHDILQRGLYYEEFAVDGRYLHRPGRTATEAAVAAGIAASIAHSVVDFVWYIPACVSMTIFLLAISWRLSRPGTDTPTDRGLVLP